MYPTESTSETPPIARVPRMIPLWWFHVALLACITFGCFMWNKVIAPRQRLVASILNNGGSVHFLVDGDHHQFYSHRKWDVGSPNQIVEYVSPTLLYPVVEINQIFDGCVPDQELLLSVQDAPQLKLIRFGAANFQSDQLRQIADVSKLSSLELDYCVFTASDFAHLQTLPLRRLLLERSSVTDDMLSTVSKMQSLLKLDLTDTNVSDRGMDHLECLPNLHSLSLRGTLVTRERVLMLKKSLPLCRIEWQPKPGGDLEVF